MVIVMVIVTVVDDGDILNERRFIRLISSKPMYHLGATSKNIVVTKMIDHEQQR